MTWEPDLSGIGQSAWRRSGNPGFDDGGNERDCRRAGCKTDLVEKSPETVTAFVHGWFDGIDAIGKRSGECLQRIVGKALKLPEDDVSGMLSGMKLTSFADNALFFGLDGNRAAVRGAVQRCVHRLAQAKRDQQGGRGQNCVDTRFVSAFRGVLSGSEGRRDVQV